MERSHTPDQPDRATHDGCQTRHMAHCARKGTHSQSYAYHIGYQPYEPVPTYDPYTHYHQVITKPLMLSSLTGIQGCQEHR